MTVLLGVTASLFVADKTHFYTDVLVVLSHTHDICDCISLKEAV